MSFEWFVARRYLTARRKQAFISLISAVSILGVGVGVMALVIALALMTGVQQQLRDRIVGSTAHIYVYKTADGGYQNIDEEMKKMEGPGVAGIAPATLGIGLMQPSLAEPAPVQIKGIDPAREPGVTDLTRSMRSGSLDALTRRPEGERDGVLLGEDLAKTLGVRVGDAVRVQTPSTNATPTGVVPRSQTLQVVGIFQFGFYEVDSAYALVSLHTAEYLLDKPGPDQIQLRLDNMDEAPAFATALRARLGKDYQVQDWTELNKPLYSALWLEKVAISTTIGLIVMVAALNIVASLVLLVMEKSRDIAILRTMGAPAGAIRRIFIYQGLTIGIVGTGVGTILGVIVSLLADHYQLIKMSAEVYQIPYLPFRVQPLDVAIVVVAGIGVCLAATLYPSRQAGRLDPAEALRNQ
jgi:lipoprotein-releasing system permease protein